MKNREGGVMQRPSAGRKQGSDGGNKHRMFAGTGVIHFLESEGFLLLNSALAFVA